MTQRLLPSGLPRRPMHIEIKQQRRAFKLKVVEGRLSRCGDMNRVPEIKMFSTMGAMRCPVAHEILGRIRRHFVGRVVTLAAATAFSAALSVALLPLATRHLGASDYGIYALVMSIVALVSAAAATGWRITDGPPVRFRRPAGMLTLPVPVAGGSIESLAHSST